MRESCLLAVVIFLLSCEVSAAAVWDGYVSHFGGHDVVVAAPYPQSDDKLSLRFYGIGIPNAKQPFGKEAAAFLLRTLPRGTHITADLVDRKNDIIPALIQVYGHSLNYKLVEEGLAWVDRRHCKAMFCRRWYIEERKAMQARKGIWSLNYGTPPWQWGEMK